MLSKYRNGQALMPKDKFHQILSEIDLTEAEVFALREQYYKEFYGEEKLARIKFIENELNNIDNSFNEIPPPLKASKSVLPDRDKITVLSGEDDIVNAVNLILDAVKTGEIITNYPYSFKALDDTLFYRTARESGYKIQHIICFGKENTECDNSANIFRSIRWLAYQINPKYCYVGNKEELEILPFPCYFAADTYCLMFNPDEKTGVAVNSKEVFSQINESFEKLSKSCLPLAECSTDILKIATEGVENFGTEKYEITKYPCLGIGADREFIYSAVRRDIPDFEYLAEIACRRYGAVNAIENCKQHLIMIQASGLMRFAETGEIREIPKAFVHEVPPEQRVHYFKVLKQLLEKDGLLIINGGTLDLPEYCQFEIRKNSFVMIYGSFKNAERDFQFNGNFYMKIKDVSLLKDFTDFTDWARDNLSFYTKEGAELLLESLILACEQMQKPDARDGE